MAPRHFVVLFFSLFRTAIEIATVVLCVQMHDLMCSLLVLNSRSNNNLASNARKKERKKKFASRTWSIKSIYKHNQQSQRKETNNNRWNIGNSQSRTYMKSVWFSAIRMGLNAIIKMTTRSIFFPLSQCECVCFVFMIKFMFGSSMCLVVVAAGVRHLLVVFTLLNWGWTDHISYVCFVFFSFFIIIFVFVAAYYFPSEAEHNFSIKKKFKFNFVYF